MDNVEKKNDVEKVILGIENDNQIMQVRFTGLLHATADMREKHGFGATKAFLLEKQGHADLKDQATALLKVLEKLENIGADGKTARLIIKAVNSLQYKRRR